MFFDFETFRELAKREYIASTGFSLSEVLAVFKYYFSVYEKVFRRPHPNIKAVQIMNIIETMPYYIDVYGREYSIAAFEYPDLIDAHFRTAYKNCDYNINHFFSGRVREMRMYDCMRGV